MTIELQPWAGLASADCAARDLVGTDDQGLALGAQLASRILAEGQAEAQRIDPGSGVPSIDWEEVAAAAKAATTTGSVISMIVVAARRQADGMVRTAKARALSPGASDGRRPLPGVPADPASSQPVARSQVAGPPVLERRDLPTVAPAAVRAGAALGGTTSGADRSSAPVLPVDPPLPIRAGTDVHVRHPRQLRLRPRRTVAYVAATWTRNVGVIVLLFVAWQLWGTGLQEHRSQAALKTSFDKAVAPTSDGATVSSTRVIGHVKKQVVVVPAPLPGSAIARIQIPKIGVDQYVVEGTAEADLREGPGHYIGSALPGNPGNAAIAGHRTTYGAPFNQLGHLTTGDVIYTTTPAGRATYVVSQPPFAVSPSDITVLNDFGDNRLTLTTCNPEYSATQRLIVVAKLVKPASRLEVESVPITAPVKSRPSTATVSPDDTVVSAAAANDIGWHFGHLPVTLLVVGLLVVLGVFDRRLRAAYGGIGSWLIMSPIWLAGLVILFETLQGLLPAGI